MGQPKGSLPWDGHTLFEHQLECLREWSQRVVVTGAHLIQDATNVPWLEVNNPAWASGRSSSIAHGAAALSGEPQAILVVAIDQPLVPEVLTRLLDDFRPGQHTLTRPYNNGTPGHPVIFSAALRPDLMEVERYEDGLRGLISEYGRWERKVRVEEPLIHADLNTRDAYEKARQRWLSRVSEIAE